MNEHEHDDEHAGDRAPLPTVEPDWFSGFFDKAANDFWEAAVPAEHTADEVTLLVEALAIDENSSVVDLAAGRGRLTIPMSRVAGHVTAIDLSIDGVAVLNDRTRSLDNVHVVRCDMRDLPFDGPMDGAWCMGNSFGYFDVEGVERYLAETLRVLRPGGRFALESATVAESLLSDLADETHHEFAGVSIVGRHRHDAARHRVVSELTIDDGTKVTTTVMDQLALPSREIRALVERSGFDVSHMLGGTDWSEYSAAAPALIVIAERPA